MLDESDTDIQIEASVDHQIVDSEPVQTQNFNVVPTNNLTVEDSSFESKDSKDSISAKKDWKKLSEKRKGYLTVASGFIWLMYLGSQSLIGNIAPYIQSYFKECDEADSTTLLPILTFVSMVANYFGCITLYNQNLNPRIHMAIGVLVGVLGCYLSSLITNFLLFKWFFMVTFGFATGFTSMLSVYVAWQYFPGNEGLVTGIIIGGFGIGGFMFTLIGVEMINPNGLKPLKNSDQPYNNEIAGHVPTTFQTLSYVFLFFGLLCVGLIQKFPTEEDELEEQNSFIQQSQNLFFENKFHPEPSSDQNTDKPSSIQGDNNMNFGSSNDFNTALTQTRSSQKQMRASFGSFKQNTLKSIRRTWAQRLRQKSLQDLCRTRQFTLIFLMNFLTIFTGFFLADSTTTYAHEYIKDSNFLELVRTIATFFGALRFIWSFSLDKFSYKRVYGSLICMQIGLIVSLPFILHLDSDGLKKTLYLSVICLSNCCLGGHFVLVPTIFAKLFGAAGGIRVYSVGYLFSGMASFVNIFLLDMFLDDTQVVGGYHGFTTIYAILNGVALFLLIFLFKEEKVEFSF